MGNNFQDNVVYGNSTLAVSGDAIIVGSTDNGAKSVIFNNSGSQGHLAWQPTANETIFLPNSGGTVQLTGQVPGAVYDGANSISTGTIVFTNANGVSFTINGQTISGSVAAISSLSATGAVSISSNGNTISIGAPAVSSLSATGIISISSNGSTISIGAPIQSINFSAGTTSNNLSAITFSNSNGMSFGLNGSIVTGSYTVPTQTNQSIGLYALGNTTQNSSTTLDARTLSFNGLGNISVGYSNGSIQISGAGGGGSVNFSAGTTSNNLTAITFSNSNGISFGLNGSTMTGSVAAQTNQSIGLYALGNTTQNSSTTLDARTLSFNGLGLASVGYSNGSIQISVSNGTVVFSNSNNITFGSAGNTTITASYSQSNQNISLFALGNTTQNSSTVLGANVVSFNGLGGNTVGYSNGSIQISGVTTNGLISIVNISAGTTSNNLSAFVFSNSNNVSFGLNGSTLTASVAAQTNQTLGLFAIGNTTQNSSTTLDARTLSFNGIGGATMGYSNGSIQVSVPPVFFQSIFNPFEECVAVSMQHGNGSLHIHPCPQAINVIFDRAAFDVIWSHSTSATSGTVTVSMWMGAFTRNASTLSLLASKSTSQSIAWQTSNSAAINGAKLMTMGWTHTFNQTDMWYGIVSSSSTAGAGAVSISQYCVSDVVVPFLGLLGISSANSNQNVLGLGYHSSTGFTMPNSIAFTDIIGTAVNALRPPLYRFLNQSA